MPEQNPENSGQENPQNSSGQTPDKHRTDSGHIGDKQRTDRGQTGDKGKKRRRKRAKIDPATAWVVYNSIEQRAAAEKRPLTSIVTQKELAFYARCSPKTVRRWRERKLITAMEPQEGRAVRLRLSNVMAAMRKAAGLNAGQIEKQEEKEREG